MQHKIEEQQKIFSLFKKECSNRVVGQITVGQAMGGMRGMLGMLYETSKLHPYHGITYREYDLY